MKLNLFKRMTSMLVAIALVVTMIPATAFAEGENQSSTEQVVEESVIEEAPVEEAQPEEPAEEAQPEEPAEEAQTEEPVEEAQPEAQKVEVQITKEPAVEAQTVEEPVVVEEAENPIADVNSSESLEQALLSGKDSIRVTADFEIDRTFYVTSNATIYADEAHVLTRAKDFAGDVFVVGEASDGTATEAEVTLTLGNPESDKEDLLVIDGNMENMTVDVVGTVVFVCANGHAKLYDNLTITNNKKMGNERTLLEVHGLSYKERIGGAAMILAANASADIFGGKYTHNYGNDTEGANLSDYGGAIFAFAPINIYGGTFENNEALRGGAFYLYRTANIYNAVIKNNSASTYGGAIYQPSSGSAKIYIGGNNDIVEPSVTFEGNTASTGAGAIYCSAALEAQNAIFQKNETDGSGGAIRISGTKKIAIDKVQFTENKAGGEGGAIYSSKTRVPVENSQFTSNTAKYGGAIYITGKIEESAEEELYVKNVEFNGNDSTESGGALHIKTGARAYVAKTKFTENSAATTGGAVYNTEAFIEMNAVEFSKNAAKDGAAIGLLNSGEAVLNKITATENTASGRGGFIFADTASKMDLYNSTFSKNEGSSGGVAYLYTGVVANVYNSTFVENKGTTHAGAFCIYASEGNVRIQDCEFKNNSANNYGGGFQISGPSLVQLYNIKGIGNSAGNGGFLYITKSGTVVDLVGVEVSGNTATAGGPIIWGNTANAKLNINKALYKDLDAAGELDDAYWAEAIANKLTVNDSTATIPSYSEYEQSGSDGEISSEVRSASQLYNAINAGHKEIILAKSFEIDRTYYIKDNVVIKSNGNYKLTRAAGFDGDMFVVGEDAEGKSCSATLTLGAADDENKIIIDGNKSNVTVDVKGSVFFVGKNGTVNLHNNITIQNHSKTANDKVLKEAYGIASAELIGGSVAIILDGGAMDIKGAVISGNSVNSAAEDTVSVHGGAIYNMGTLNMENGLIENCSAVSGGAIYVKNGQAVYEGVTFEGNKANASGGAIYASGKNKNVRKYDTKIQNCTFKNNSGKNGGAILLTDAARMSVEESNFEGNTAAANGGAIANNGGSLNVNGAEFTGNQAENGGAVFNDESAKATLNKVNAAANQASAAGGFAYAKASEFTLYDSQIKDNTAALGGAVALGTGAVTKLNKNTFESNDASDNGGALYVVAGETATVTHDCKFIENTAQNNGGAVCAGEASVVEMYNSEATSNTAKKGGVIYVAETGANVTINGITVANNNASEGGTVVYGETNSAIVNINKNAYTDSSHVGELDENYWAQTITGSVVVNDSEGTVPSYPEYGNESAGDMKDAQDVKSAEELENALLAGHKHIRVVEDFEIDRTFYITYDVTIFSTKEHTLTRAAGFAGDIFVVGEAADGTATENEVSLTLGNPASKTVDLLIIDGNKDNMTVDVVGTVIFVCANGHVNLYENLTVTNNKKVNNERTLSGKHGISYPERVGGAAMIVAANASADIYGGTYSHNYTNTASSAKVSDYGGAIYAFATINIYGGLFEHNEALRGGAFYLYRVANIYNAAVKNNHASTYGGAIYQPASTGAKIYLGGENEVVDPSVTFEGNTASSGAGAIYCSATMNVKNTVFEKNETPAAGGAIRISGTKNVTVEKSQFANNAANGEGGAIYLTKSKVSVEDVQFTSNNASYGGAIYTTGKNEDTTDVELFVRNTEFNSNNATSSGGALLLKEGARSYVTKTKFTKNNADANGGAVYNTAAFVEMNNVEFSKNTSKVGAAIELLAAGEAVLNKIIATENTASGNGGFLHANEGSKLDLYNSTISNNKALSGGAAYLYRDVVANVYNSKFEENTTTSNAGAFCIYTYAGNVRIQDCEFNKNSSTGLGGGFQISGESKVQLYNNKGTENSADKGGFLYITTSGTVVELVGVEVSGNTATTGGPIIWGNTLNAKLNINKALYKDLDASGELDDAYWAAAIANKLTVNDSTATIPSYTDYVQPMFDHDVAWEVETVGELYRALLEGHKEIKLLNDLTVNRTLYVTADTTIYSDNDCKITRAHDFTGDVFVVGKDEQGNTSSSRATLTIGKTNSDACLVFDGNADHMLNDVTGTVFRVTEMGELKILGVSELKNNHIVSTGGSVVFVEQGGKAHIEGAAFTNNSAKDANGGAIYSEGTVDISNSSFSGNEATDGGAIYCMNDLTVEDAVFNDNRAANGGAIAVVDGGKVSIANVEASANEASGNGGFIYGSGTETTISDCQISNNKATNGGAIAVDKETFTNLNDNEFIANTAAQNGGVIYIAGEGIVQMHGITAKENSAVKGGVIFVDAKDVKLILNSMTVSDNTGEGHLAYASVAGTTLELDKSKYKDLNTDTLDKEYWAKAIVNIDIGTYSVYDVSSAAELEQALKKGIKDIRIVADFEIDRTFYITYDVTIFSTKKRTLTRASGFAGDMFVIGHNSSGKTNLYKDGPAVLTVGDPTSKSENLLIIDGNKDNMTVDVAGTVFFVCFGSEVKLYNNLTVKNCHKIENARSKESLYNIRVSEQGYMGGPVAIVSDGTMYVYGGNYLNNSARTDVSGDAGKLSSLGGAIYNTATLRVYDGNFEGNKGYSGGAIYNRRIAYVYDGEFRLNEASGTGGALYQYSSAGAHTYIGDHKDAKYTPVFEENYAKSNGGVLYNGALSALIVDNATFKNNTSGSSGAVICSYGTMTSRNNTFQNNKAANRGGAVYVSHTDDENDTRIMAIKNCKFIGNEGVLGGAVSVYCGSTEYKNGAIVNIDDCEFTGNKALKAKSTSTSAFGGAVYADRKGNIKINNCNFTENHSDLNGGAVYFTGQTNATLKKASFKGNTANKGGAAYITNSTTEIRESEMLNNSAPEGGAVYLYNGAAAKIYKTDFTGNTASNRGAALFSYTAGTEAIVHSCNFTDNAAEVYGGAVLASGKSILSLYNTVAKNNTAQYGGFLYETVEGTTVNLIKLTVAGNTASSGNIVRGNNEAAVLNVNKSLITDEDYGTIDDAYWPTFAVGDLKVNSVSTDVIQYEAAAKPASTSAVDVDKVFALAKKSNNGSINKTYDKFPKLKDKSNFMSKGTTKFSNINGKTVTVDTFVYPDHGKADNMNFGLGTLIYQAMLYKKAHPSEHVTIDTTSYRFSVQSAVNINRDGRYFGYMRNLENNKEYDEYGFVRIAYLLTCAASMGIEVTVVGNLDGYPVSSNDKKLKKYFADQLDRPCDSTYVKTKGKVVGDYLNFKFADWSLDAKGGTDMMHTKMAAVSHYLDKDGKAHKNTIYTSSSNMDGIRPDGANGNWKVQTGTIISDHEELYKVSSNYLRLIAEYSGQEDIYDFQKIVNERNTVQAKLIKEGKANQIPDNEQIIYLGTSKDKVFEMYFTPIGGGNIVWDEENNPYAKYARELMESDDYILFTWNSAEYSSSFHFGRQLEQAISDAFHNNKNPRNKIYVNAEKFNTALFDDLKVGTDIGYKSFNKLDYGKIHNKDLQFSYSKNGQRMNVTMHNSCNFHSGSASYQSNFFLIIKETSCSPNSVFGIIAKNTTKGDILGHTYGAAKASGATATKHGTVYATCKDCGYKQKTGVAHYSSDWIVDKKATATANGTRHKECTVCGTVLKKGTYAFTVSADRLLGKKFAASTNEKISTLKATPKTIEAIIHISKSYKSTPGVIVGNYSDGSGNQLNLEIAAGGKPLLRVKNGSKSTSYKFKTDVRSSGQNHIAITIGTDKVSLYVGGKLKESLSLTSAIPEVTTGFRIGGDNRKGNTQYFRGTIYAVNMFSDVRTAKEIAKDKLLVVSDAGNLIFSKYYDTTRPDAPEVAVLGGKTFSKSKRISVNTLSATPKTIEAIIKLPKKYKDRAGVIVGNYDGSGKEMNLEIGTKGRPKLYFNTGKAKVTVQFSTDVRTNSGAKHIAVTVSGKKAYLFVDGVKKETKKLKYTLPSGITKSFKIGGDNRKGNTQYFRGTIYAVNMFSDARTSGEIKKDAKVVTTSAASQIYTGYFTASNVSTGYGKAMLQGEKFNQSDIITINKTLSATPRTIEATIALPKTYSDRGGVIVGNYDGSGKEMNLEIGTKGRPKLYFNTGKAKVSVQFSTDIRTSSGAKHIAVTVSGKKAYLYVDGVKKETKRLSYSLPSGITSGFKIGGDNRSGNDQYFKGTIYSVNMFSDVRSSSEIKRDTILITSKASDVIYTGYFAAGICSANTTAEAHKVSGKIVDYPATSGESGVSYTKCTTCGKRFAATAVSK